MPTDTSWLSIGATCAASLQHNSEGVLHLKAVVIHAARDLRIEEVAKPIPGPGQVVCRVAAAGICGSDIEIYHGSMPYIDMGMLTFPWTPGHEWSGLVDTVGAGVADLKPGDRVTGECSVPCGGCAACLSGQYHCCANRTEVGLVGAYPGAFAEYILMPAAQIVRIPNGVSLREAAMTEPVGVTMHGLDHLSIRPGENVVVLGDGTIGLLAAQMALASGASPVVLVGEQPQRMAIGLKTGLKHVVNTNDPHSRDQILAALDGRADYVVEATGNPRLFDFAASLIKMGGKLLVISFYPVNELCFNFMNFAANEIQICTTFSAVNCFPRVLRLMAGKKIDVLPLQSAYYTLAQAAQAFEDTDAKRTSGVKTLIVDHEILD
jgi:L-iditol 2-dehydrogenase